MGVSLQRDHGARLDDQLVSADLDNTTQLQPTCLGQQLLVQRLNVDRVGQRASKTLPMVELFDALHQRLVRIDVLASCGITTVIPRVARHRRRSGP
ncbi:MAG: hypothetical protein R3E66_01530 [bacterium]